jgi:NADPH:quinone reductase-like Zn-dependent oxidoreductase
MADRLFRSLRRHTADQLSSNVRMVEQGTLKLVLGPTFPFEGLVDAHRVMDANCANGKVVVVISPAAREAAAP